MSKLDRFLLSLGLLDSLPRLSALVLEKKEPDHRPILLREQNLDYGAYPFRVFHSWFLFPCFDDLVKPVWMQKLQLLKSKIRVWIAERRYMTTSRRTNLQKDIDKIYGMILDGSTSDVDRKRMMACIKELREMEHLENLDIAQKVKAKWGIEGDENSQVLSRYS